METDRIIDGYHIIENKAQNKPKVYQEFKAHWIKSPITSIAANFSEKQLNKKLYDNIQLAGFKEFLPSNFFFQYAVQNVSISNILDQYSFSPLDYTRCRDVCISAPTGQGKTLCFLIPAINLLINRKIPAIRVLIVVPVKDLAKQIYDITEKLIAETGLKASLIVGGDKSFLEEVEDLIFHYQTKYYLSDIVICTPGRLVDHIFNNPQFNLDHLRLLIVDEADRLVGDDHQDWYIVLENYIYFSKNSLKKFPNASLEYAINIKKDLPMQKILSSATLLRNPALLKKFNLHLPMLILQDALKSLSNQNNDKIFEILETPKGLTEFILVTQSKDRLINFLSVIHENLSTERILVFIKNKEQAMNLIKFLENCSPKVNAKLICGSFNLKRRQKYLDDFKMGKNPILICTDAMARGMDIENVTTVINLDYPPSPVVYIHRSGRTARFDKNGRVITFLDPTQVD